METAHLAPTRPIFTAGHKIVYALKEDWSLYRRYRRTLGELRSLSEEELWDLSELHRTAEDLAYATVYGRKMVGKPNLRLVK